VIIVPLWRFARDGKIRRHVLLDECEVGGVRATARRQHAAGIGAAGRLTERDAAFTIGISVPNMIARDEILARATSRLHYFGAAAATCPGGKILNRKNGTVCPGPNGPGTAFLTGGKLWRSAAISAFCACPLCT
jgi:hypothetical protein